MLEVVIGVLVMEVDNVADDVTDMEVDKVTNMKTFLICHDFYGDGVGVGDGHGG